MSRSGVRVPFSSPPLFPTALSLDHSPCPSSTWVAQEEKGYSRFSDQWLRIKSDTISSSSWKIKKKTTKKHIRFFLEVVAIAAVAKLV